MLAGLWCKQRRAEALFGRRRQKKESEAPLNVCCGEENHTFKVPPVESEQEPGTCRNRTASTPFLSTFCPDEFDSSTTDNENTGEGLEHLEQSETWTAPGRPQTPDAGSESSRGGFHTEEEELKPRLV